MSRPRSRRVWPDLLVALALITSGCAAQSQNPAQNPEQTPPGAEEFNDPFEDTNRAIFRFNEKVDHAVLVPVAKAYRNVLPEPVRDSIRDFLNNLDAPLIFANDTLQGQFKLARDTLARFVIDSTIGMGGLVDVAGRWGIPYHEQDLGVTLGVWGIASGPYLVIPILGPSDPRDLGGKVAQGFGDPWNRLAGDNNLLWVTFVRGGVAGIDTRSRYIESLADIERTSLDYYATIRSLYRQRRAALIEHNRENLPPNPGLSENGAGPTAATASRNSGSVVISEVPHPLEVSR